MFHDRCSVIQGIKRIHVHNHTLDRQKWCLKSSLLEFVRFSTPHNGEATETLIYDSIVAWDLLDKVHAATTDNAKDIIKGIKILNTKCSPKSITNVRCACD